MILILLFFFLERLNTTDHMHQSNTLNYYSYGYYNVNNTSKVGILTPAFGIETGIYKWSIEEFFNNERNRRFFNDCWMLMLMWDLVCIAKIISKRKKCRIMYVYV